MHFSTPLLDLPSWGLRKQPISDPIGPSVHKHRVSGHRTAPRARQKGDPARKGTTLQPSPHTLLFNLAGARFALISSSSGFRRAVTRVAIAPGHTILMLMRSSA